MTLDLYNPRLLRLAAEATAAGRLPAADGSAEILNPTCGDRIRVDVTRDGEQITAVGYEVHACVLTQASASLLGRLARGRTAAGIRAAAERLEAMLRSGAAPPDDLADYTVFEPVRAHPSRHTCVMLPFQALLAALAADGRPDRGS